MPEIKSSYEIALEKMNKMGIDTSASLTEEQRERVAEIKNKYEARIAEKRILLKNAPELPDEIQRLEQEQDKEIKAVYDEAKDT